MSRGWLVQPVANMPRDKYKMKKRRSISVDEDSSDSESVDEFTKQFMSKTKHLIKNTDIAEVHSEDGDDSSEKLEFDSFESERDGSSDDDALHKQTSNISQANISSNHETCVSKNKRLSLKSSLQSRSKGVETLQIKLPEDTHVQTDDSTSDTSEGIDNGEEDENSSVHSGNSDNKTCSDDDHMKETNDSNISCLSEEEITAGTSICETDESAQQMTAEDVEDGFSNLRKELADLPFSELQLLKEKIGVKAYNQAMFGCVDSREKKKRFKRENKNRPMELTSKRTVARFREVIQVKKRVHRDPRFDDLSGEYDEKIFKKAYSFLGDVKQREKQKLLKRYQKEKDEEKRLQIERLVKRMNEQERTDKEKETRFQKDSERKKREMELIKQGKRPYFLKKGDQKKLELAEKFQELKKSGKVDAYMAKKRKKTTAKDRKLLPKKHSKLS